MAEFCPDCGAQGVAGREGCEVLFQALTGKAFSNVGWFALHRLVVDVYALQHPDKYCRSGKSLVAHLTGVCVALEYGERKTAVNRAIQQWLSGASQPLRPDPPPPRQRGQLTIVSISQARSLPEFHDALYTWARDVWQAWQSLHPYAHECIQAALNQKKDG